MSDLIRYHDYLAMIGTGEVSYLIFAEVLYPVSNISLSQPNYANNFIDFLLLLNLADIAGTIGKVGGEDFTVLIHDFQNIKKIHENMADIHGILPYGNYIDVISRLQRLSEDHTQERLRRLLRTGFKKLAKQDKLLDYIKWIDNYEGCSNQVALKDSRNKSKMLSSWFSRNYDTEINDIVPINSSLRGINVKPEFYTKFAFICKLDYFLYFLEKLFDKILDVEIEKTNNKRKSPHDIRRDLSMTLVEIVNVLIELYGNFTSNDVKIGLGFERFKEMHDPDKMLRRLTGVEGEFKEAEACTKFRSMVVLWVITP